LIGRKEEINTLTKLCNNNKSKLAVVYGRRRIGKTYLIEQMFTSSKNCLFFSFTGAYEGDNKTQLYNFKEAIYDWFKIDTEPFNNWTEAFHKLKRILNDEMIQLPVQNKVVIFIDELPWIDRTNKTDFNTALGYFWNTYCLKSNNFLMILCGSNAAWIKNKVLEDEKGPHHKRVDKIIALKPFTLEETAQYIKKEKKLDIDSKTIIELYMIFGGVAKYLSYYDADKTISQNVNEIFFSVDGLLYGEYELLFKSLFIDKDGTYRNIVEQLVQLKSGLTTIQITKNLGVGPTSGKIRNALNDLAMSGFIISISKTKYDNNAKYIIADPFILFYSKWVMPLSKNDILQKKNYWESVMRSHAYSIWTGFSFELVCMINIHKYVEKRGLTGVYKGVSYWNHTSTHSEANEQGAQIDLLVEYENDCYDIVECKYHNDEVTITKEMKSNLINKKNMFIKYGLTKKKFDIKTIFISPYGVKENSHYNDVSIFTNYLIDIFI